MLRALSSLLVALTLISACDTPTSTTPTTTPTTATPTTATTTATARVPDNATGKVLAGYEALRVAFAADDANGVVAAADAFKVVAAAYDGPGKDDVVAGAAALDVLAVDANNADSFADFFQRARIAFGTVSRGVVAVIAADASLQEGRFLFECPMAQGYQRWVQTAPKMANPYMGTRMLECGSAIATWRVAG